MKNIELKLKANNIRKETVKAIHNAKSGHPGGSLSAAEKVLLRQKKEDIALMRTIPGMTVINPADDVEAKAAVEAAILTSAMKTGKVVTVEEHSVIGGLGSAVADVVSAKNVAKVLKIVVQDIFGQSGSGMELIKEYGLNSENIFKKKRFFK